jgi:mono/diheme cytochrome c family protein
MRRPHVFAFPLLVCAVMFVAGSGVAGPKGQGDPKHGEYLVGFGGCNDCHTPKIMGPKGPVPNPAKLLSGHHADANLPDLPQGLFAPGKWGGITNADMTAWVGGWGTGAWSEDVFIKAMRTGKHLGTGRDILPPMPWFSLAALTDQDLKDIFAYLHSVKPIVNKVPVPVPPR